MMRKITVFTAMMAMFAVFGFGAVPEGSACVGKTLVVGALNDPQQQVLAQMLSILISERTGTTVKVVSVASHAEAHEALLRADLDMYVEYTGIGQVELLNGAPIADQDQLYQAVKERYNQDFNLVWLKPFGFVDPRLTKDGAVAEAAPVVRKDTLKKFPALARLINKLGGAIDLPTMEKLEADSQGSSSRDVARQFLKQNRFI
jgi:osmoprotectant transport system substrate-binding protein